VVKFVNNLRQTWHESWFMTSSFPKRNEQNSVKETETKD